jgi:hypothetical protein
VAVGAPARDIDGNLSHSAVLIFRYIPYFDANKLLCDSG